MTKIANIRITFSIDNGKQNKLSFSVSLQASLQSGITRICKIFIPLFLFAQFPERFVADRMLHSAGFGLGGAGVNAGFTNFHPWPPFRKGSSLRIDF